MLCPSPHSTNRFRIRAGCRRGANTTITVRTADDTVAGSGHADRLRGLATGLRDGQQRDPSIAMLDIAQMLRDAFRDDGS